MNIQQQPFHTHTHTHKTKTKIRGKVVLFGDFKVHEAGFALIITEDCVSTVVLDYDLCGAMVEEE